MRPKNKSASNKVARPRMSHAAPGRVAIIVPAHDEAAMIDACLQAIESAATEAMRLGIDVVVYVVCDACRDDTAARVAAHGAVPLVIDARNVGTARAAGAAVALFAGATWLAFTDADTLVSPTWVIDQLSLGADAFCGTIGVDDWGVYGRPMHEHFRATYRDADGHRHIHGANFGISAAAYKAVGGFQSLQSSEDVAIVDALLAANLTISWSARPRVTTSARTDFRAPAGFGATLERIAASFPAGLGTAKPVGIAPLATADGQSGC